MAQSAVKTSDKQTDKSAETTAAYDAMVAVKDRLTALDTEARAKLVAIAKAEEDLGRLVFSEKLPEAEKLEATIEQMKVELARVNLGQRAAAEKLEAARQAVHEATSADTIALAKRLCTARAKTVSELSDCIQLFYKLVSKVRAHNDKISAWWPTGGEAPGGTLLNQGHMMRAIMNEIDMISRPTDPLGRNIWKMPGAEAPILLGGAKELPLVEHVKIADQHIIALVSKAPGDAP
jgi:hypothetical protein